MFGTPERVISMRFGSCTALPFGLILKIRVRVSRFAQLRGTTDGCGKGSHTTTHARTEVLQSDNSFANTPPMALPLELLHGSSTLAPNESLNVPLVLHAEQAGTQELAVLLIFREVRRHS